MLADNNMKPLLFLYERAMLVYVRLRTGDLLMHTDVHTTCMPCCNVG